MTEVGGTSGHRRGAAALAGVLALFVLLASAPFAQASYDPLGSGQTRLTLDRAFLSFLKRHGVKLEAKSPAKLRAGTLVIPVSGGEMDPLIGKGTIEGEGALLFERGKRSLPFKRLTVKTKRAPLQAKVGGNQLKVAQGAKIATRRSGFGTTFSAKGLELSAKVATRLNKKLHLGRAFEEGQQIGSLRSNAQPVTVAILPTGRATLALDPGFVAKMNSLFVSINPIFPTELAPGNVLTSPIVLGGKLAPDASIGTLRTAGAIEFLQQGAGQVFLNEFWFEMGSRTALAEIDIEPTPTFKGKLGQVGALGIGSYAVASDPGARTIAVSGTPLALSAQTAAAFNEAFAEGKATFAAGETFGTVSFEARGQ